MNDDFFSQLEGRIEGIHPFLTQGILGVSVSEVFVAIGIFAFLLSSFL